MNFQLSRSGVAMVATGAAALAGLIGGGGFMAGSARSAPAAAVPAATTTAAPATPAAPPPAAPAPPAETFALRVRTVASEGDAKDLLSDLKDKSIDAIVVPNPLDGITLYSVDLKGRWPSRQEANDIARALFDKTGIETFVISVPPPTPKP